MVHVRVRRPAEGGTHSRSDAGADRWRRFLSTWGLGGALAMVALFATLGAVQSSAAAGAMGPDLTEFAAALHNLAVYRIGSALDIAVWLALGGMFVALGAILAPRAPVRAGLVAVCGVGQLAGAIGGFTRLEGITRLAAGYAEADSAEQALRQGAARALQLVINIHFGAGSVLWTAALLLVASVAWRMEWFPRWLAVAMALTGALNLVTDVFGATSPTGAPDAFGILALTGLLVVFLGVWRTFRRSGPGVREEA